MDDFGGRREVDDLSTRRRPLTSAWMTVRSSPVTATTPRLLVDWHVLAVTPT